MLNVNPYVNIFSSLVFDLIVEHFPIFIDEYELTGHCQR